MVESSHSPSRPDPVSPGGAGPDGDGVGPESELPSVGARLLAFVAVLAGGAAGGFIGHAFGVLGGFSDFATGVITLLVGLGAAAGVAVIAVLTLRAFGEWNTIRRRGPRAVREAKVAAERRRARS